MVLIDFGMSLAEEIKTFSITYLLSLHVYVYATFHQLVLSYMLCPKYERKPSIYKCSNNGGGIFETGKSLLLHDVLKKYVARMCET